MATPGQVINASSLFSASDADGDGLLYLLWDDTASPTSGHFEINGVVQAADTTFAVNATQLAQTTFAAGTTGTDDAFCQGDLGDIGRSRIPIAGFDL
jgi:hypothetical protein